jgi:hypothetical protein
MKPLHEILSIFSTIPTEAMRQPVTSKNSVNGLLGAQREVLVEMLTDIIPECEDGYMYLHSMPTLQNNILDVAGEF